MRILVVEDDAEIKNFLKSGLEAEGFSVDVAEDGETGSYMGRTNDYDLIILDNMLPKKEGIVVCQEIRKCKKPTRIILLSVKSEVFHKVDLLNSGADDYVTKPFSFIELLARIRAILRRPQTIEEDTLSIDNLILDRKKQTAVRGKKLIYLTRKEYQLLEYLMKHNGTFVSRGMIMEHVWDMNCDPFSNTIEAHILNLRKKIDIPRNKKLIQTVPGRGYKIDIHR